MVSNNFFRVLLLLLIVLFSGCSVKESVSQSVVGNSSDVIVGGVEKKVCSENLSAPIINRLVHFQLQDAKFSSLKGLGVDFLVVDVDDVALSGSELEGLESNKTVLSYLSIGEAEDYRSYWLPGWGVGNPSFLDEENVDLKGNYKVRYWDEGWQDIVFSRVKDIAQKGYNGVFIDLVDAYGYYEEGGRVSAAQEMVDFVKKISEKGREINPDFLVVSNNAVNLYRFDDFKGVIDGFGKENTWFVGDEVQDVMETSYVLGVLDKVVSDGKFVLAIDYPSEKVKVCDFYRNCWAHGFVCGVSNNVLSLDSPVSC